MSSDLKNVLVSAGSSFVRTPAATAQDVAELEEALATNLPAEYRQFLLWSNGGELIAEGQAMDFWDTRRTVVRNERLHIRERLPSIVLIGSNEGEIAIGFARDTDSSRFIAVPFGDLSIGTIKTIGESAGEAVALILSRKIELDEVCWRK